MREVKFRAWQKHYKEMFAVSAIQFRNPAFVVKQDSLETWTLDEVELMQYTGLKDKNGTEIYEGDILAGKGIYWTCQWSGDHARFIVATPNKYNTERHATMLKSMPWAIERLEVVGNVYETPDLLSKED